MGRIDPQTIIVLAIIVAVIATVVQRITGMGFALVATPGLVLLFGPRDGVLLVIVTGLVVSVLMLVTGWRLVDWRRTWRVLIAAAPMILVGAWVASAVNARVLMFIVAGAALLSLIAPWVRGTYRLIGGRGGPYVAGAASAFLHVTSGLSGPPLIAYGTATRWNQLSFVESLQVIFIALHLATIAVRGVPQVHIGLTLVLIVAVLVGLIVGRVVSRWIPASLARRAMFIIAWLGTLTVLARALTGSGI